MCTQNFKNVIRGDSFGEKTITIKNKTTLTPKDLTGVLIKCQFRYQTKIGDLVKEISETDGIVIFDPTNGKFRVESFIVNWNAGIYFYDFQFTFPDESITTYFGGFIKVLQDVTQNT